MTCGRRWFNTLDADLNKKAAFAAFFLDNS
jgi:hypothetical protein